MAKVYKLQIPVPPTASIDGSGTVGHEVWKVWREDTASGSDPWFRTPRHKDGIPIAHTDVTTILALPTSAQRIAAYRAKLFENKDVIPTPNTGWSDAQLDAFYAENDAATLAAAAMVQFVADLGKTFPVEF